MLHYIIYMYLFCFVLDFENFVKTTLTNLKYEMKSLSYSVETIKNMTAQVIDSSLPKQTLDYDISDGFEIMWPIENSDDMDKIEKLLVDIKIRKNQVIIIINCTQHSV